MPTEDQPVRQKRCRVFQLFAAYRAVNANSPTRPPSLATAVRNFALRPTLNYRDNFYSLMIKLITRLSRRELFNYVLFKRYSLHTWPRGWSAKTAKKRRIQTNVQNYPRSENDVNVVHKRLTLVCQGDICLAARGVHALTTCELSSKYCAFLESRCLGYVSFQLK